MRRFLPFLALAVFLLPTQVEAQPRFMVSGGFTAPMGDLSDAADAGYHGQVGLFVSIPTIPFALRGDGFFHRLGSSDAALEDTQILGGTLSLVYDLPGIGLVPYFLAGVGAYQLEAGPVGATVKANDNGFHGGFGVNIGGVGTGVGAFAEIRYVKIGGNSDASFIPLTFGLRL